MDLALAEGTPFVAAHGGTVVLARSYGGYGLCIEIDTGNGITTVYGHASALLVREGQKVDAGQAIGLVGSTGFSFAPQLHFEIRQHDNAVDPASFLLSRGVDLVNKTQAIDAS
jgi:murein DD-endopeptidase MepM/ murein hydrolase activator NlpD